MTLACLGWGSLIWEPKNLPVAANWHSDGPTLPIEFARQSDNGRITLVVTKGVTPQPVLWAELSVVSLRDARYELRRREDVPPKNIDCHIGCWSAETYSDHAEVAVVAKWAREKKFSGVVWTALPAKFDGSERKPSCDEVLRHLSSLTGEAKAKAEQYVRCAPGQIRTPYRDEIEKVLEWMPRPSESCK